MAWYHLLFLYLHFRTSACRHCCECRNDHFNWTSSRYFSNVNLNSRHRQRKWDPHFEIIQSDRFQSWWQFSRAIMNDNLRIRFDLKRKKKNNVEDGIITLIIMTIEEVKITFQNLKRPISYNIRPREYYRIATPNSKHHL